MAVTGLPLIGFVTLLSFTKLSTPRHQSDGRRAGHLKQFTDLRTLDLCGTTISGTGLKVLDGLARAQRPDLPSTKITDAGLEHVGRLEDVVGLESLLYRNHGCRARTPLIALADSVAWGSTTPVPRERPWRSSNEPCRTAKLAGRRVRAKSDEPSLPQGSLGRIGHSNLPAQAPSGLQPETLRLRLSAIWSAQQLISSGADPYLAHPANASRSTSRDFSTLQAPLCAPHVLARHPACVIEPRWVRFFSAR